MHICSKIFSRPALAGLTVVAALIAAWAPAAGDARSVLPCDQTVRPGQSIQAAVNRARAGDVVCVRFGRYVEAPNVFVGPAKANLTIVGLPVRGPFGISAPPMILAGGHACTIAVRARGVHISNLSLIGGPAGGTDGLCFLGGSDGSRATDVVAFRHRHFGFLVSQTSGVGLQRVHATQNREIGIHGISSHGITIRDSTVARNGNLGGARFYLRSGIRFFAVEQSLISRTTVTRSRGVGIYLNGVSDRNVIERNTVADNGDDGINFESNADDKYGDDNPAVPARNIIRSNRLLRNADEGLHVYSGSRNRFLSNQVAASRLSGVVIDCQAGADNQLRSNTIEGNGTGPQAADVFDSGVVLRNVEPVLVEQNAIRENPADGIHVERVSCARNRVLVNAGPTAQVLKKNTIERNTKSGIHVSGVERVQVLENALDSNGTQGIRFDTGDMNGPAKNGVIRGNTVFRSGRSGIYLLEHADSTLLEDNTIQRSGLDGLNVQESNDVSVIRLASTENERHGLYAVRADGLGVLESTFSGNRGDGIHLQSVTSSLLRGNQVRTNTASGIRLEPGSATNTFRLNHVEGNATGIHVEAGAAGNTILTNTFTGNAQNGFSANPYGTNVWFVMVGDCPAGNFWSDIAGPILPECPEIRTPAKELPDERDRGPLVSPPA